MSVANSAIIASEQVVFGQTDLGLVNIRPQRLHTWLNLIPVDEYEKNRPEKILFLDTFAVVKPGVGGEKPYTVLFEGKEEMQYNVHLGIIFVWYGDDLQAPDKPFPTLFETPYNTKYLTSKPVVFENTHVMDFVENGSDNLHFKCVHLWDYSKIYNHKITPEAITLEQDTKIHYGRCSFNRFIRFMSYILPELELHHDYVYHGPGIAIVGAEGKGSPESHSLVTLTPEGSNRTRVYVTIAMPETTFPTWAEKLFKLVSPKKKLCEVSAGLMANYIKNEFDVDAVIWKHRRVKQPYNLLSSEQHLQEVVDWGKTFYPSDFVEPTLQSIQQTEKAWHVLDVENNIKVGEINSYKVASVALVAYKDSKGEIHVRDAYCPHQGAHLGAQGIIEDDCLRCPFHGFYFDGEGHCRGQNINNTSKSIDKLKMEIIEYRVSGDAVEVFL